MNINMNFLMQMLMSKLQNINPKGYEFVNSAMNNGGDPSAVLNQMMKGATSEQKQNLLNQCKQYGVPENVLKQIQNMK